MFVRITKGLCWYKDRVGEVFEVVEDSWYGEKRFYPKNEQEKNSMRKFISPENCEVIEDSDYQQIEKEYLDLLRKTTDLYLKYYKKITNMETTVIGPNRFCGECKHLNYTEEEQRRSRTQGGYDFIVDHFCKKYMIRVTHKNQHPNIFRCDECMKEG